MAGKKNKEIGRNGGWYWYEDGTVQWVYGMSAPEKRAHERMHGKVRFHCERDEDFERYERKVAPTVCIG